jgi:hypothetical protein
MFSLRNRSWLADVYELMFVDRGAVSWQLLVRLTGWASEMGNPPDFAGSTSERLDPNRSSGLSGSNEVASGFALPVACRILGSVTLQPVSFSYNQPHFLITSLGQRSDSVVCEPKGVFLGPAQADEECVFRQLRIEQ